jgi:hypothetical protein
MRGTCSKFANRKASLDEVYVWDLLALEEPKAGTVFQRGSLGF